MFCTRCGNYIAEDACFCDNCGTPVVPPIPKPPMQVSHQQPAPPAMQSQHMQTQNQTGSNYRSQKPNRSLSLPIKIITGTLLLIFLLGGILFTTRHTYKDPLYLTFEASCSGDLGDILKLIPEDVNNAMDEQLSDADLDNLEKTLESYYVWQGEQLTETFGNNPKIKIRVQDKASLSEQELAEENQNIFARFGNAYPEASTDSVKNLRDMQATKGYDLLISARIKGDKYEEVKDYRVRVLQIDNQWYTTDFYYIVPAYLLA